MDTVHKRRGDKIIILFIVLLVGIVLTQTVSAYFSSSSATIHLGDGEFTAKVADTDEARIKGLSGTKTLASDEAMLLVGEGNSRRGIWMKDMNYSIDVVWLDDSRRVVDFVMNVPPDSYPKVFTPKVDARYTLELRSGTIKDKGIRVGQVAFFSGTSKEI